MKVLLNISLLAILIFTGSTKVQAANPPCSSTPAIAAINDSTICSSHNTVYLNATLTNASALEWYGPSGRFFPDDETVNAHYVPSQAEIDSGYVNIYVRTTGTNPCPTAYDTLRITILSAPDDDVQGPLNICEYSVGNQYSVSTIPNGSYEWHVVGGTIDSGDGTNEISVTWGSEGSGYIYVILEDSNSCEGVGSTNPISRYNFNTNAIGEAAVGPDAISYDSDAYSDGEGFGIEGNCQGQKGLDLELDGTIFDRGKIAMTFSWQRDENNANFFERGGMKFWINGGQLRIEFEQKDDNGNAIKVGPINTSYTVPNDDVYRYFTFAYDSSSGVARVLVNDSIVWQLSTGNAYSLYWTGAGNAIIGENMDGTCSGNPLLDWLNISIPISIVPGPLSGSSMTGDAAVCQYNAGTYTADTSSAVQYAWSVTGGSLLTGQGTEEAEFYFSAQSAEVNLTVEDNITGCDTTMTYTPTINSVDAFTINGDDTLCVSDTVIFTTASVNDRIYSWSTSGGSTIGSSTDDSLQIAWNAQGNSYLNLIIEDTLTGCSAADSIVISSASYPSPAIVGPDSTCQSATELYTASNTTYDLFWSVSNATLNSNASDNEVSITAPSSGSILLNLTETNSAYGCATEVSKSIGIFGKPVTGVIQH